MNLKKASPLAQFYFFFLYMHIYIPIIVVPTHDKAGKENPVRRVR